MCFQSRVKTRRCHLLIPVGCEFLKKNKIMSLLRDFYLFLPSSSSLCDDEMRVYMISCCLNVVAGFLLDSYHPTTLLPLDDTRILSPDCPYCHLKTVVCSLHTTCYGCLLVFLRFCYLHQGGYGLCFHLLNC